jgi:hypothetical protein
VRQLTAWRCQARPGPPGWLGPQRCALDKLAASGHTQPAALRAGCRVNIASRVAMFVSAAALQIAELTGGLGWGLAPPHPAACCWRLCVAAATHRCLSLVRAWP